MLLAAEGILRKKKVVLCSKSVFRRSRGHKNWSQIWSQRLNCADDPPSPDVREATHMGASSERQAQKNPQIRGLVVHYPFA